MKKLILAVGLFLAFIIALTAPGAYWLITSSPSMAIGAPSALVDHGYKGTTGTFTANETIGTGKLCYFSSNSTMALTDADDSSHVPGIAISLSDLSSAGSGQFLLKGYFRDDSYLTLTVGGYVYVSTTSGNITQTAPSGSGDQVQQIGIAVGTKTIYLNPDITIVELE